MAHSREPSFRRSKGQTLKQKSYRSSIHFLKLVHITFRASPHHARYVMHIDTFLSIAHVHTSHRSRSPSLPSTPQCILGEGGKSALVLRLVKDVFEGEAYDPTYVRQEDRESSGVEERVV